MYSNDSFFDLTVPGQIGLAILSVALCIITIWLFLKVSNRFGLLVKVLLAFVFLWAFTWLSPQIYYTYYWFIFDSLPIQNVIHLPPTPLDVIRLMTFSGEQNLSAHSRGGLFWIMIVITFWRRYQPSRP